MIFRDATEGDLGAVVALLADDPLGAARKAPGDPGYAAAFARIAARPGDAVIVAEDAGTVVACLQLTILPGLSRRGASRAQIEAVRVAAARRGRGLGAAIVRHALDRARREGCVLAQLTSDLTRADAHRFYERLGFTRSHAGFKLTL